MASPEPIFQILSAPRITLALRTAIELDLFTPLDKSPLTAEKLARKRKSSARGARILMDALLSTRLVTKNRKTGEYRLGSLGRDYLVKGRPGFIGPILELQGHPGMQAAMASLPAAVRKGGCTIESNAHSESQSFWETFATVTSLDAIPMAKQLARIAGVTRNSGPMKVLDLACGSGRYGITIAETNPRAEVTLFDRANVLRKTRPIARKSKAAARIRFRSGNLFEADLGGPYDLVVASHILHHFSLEECDLVVKRIHSSLNPGGKVAIQEFIVDNARASRTRQIFFSLVMLVWTDKGEAWSFQDYRQLLAGNSFRNIRFMNRQQPSQFVIAERSR